MPATMASRFSIDAARACLIASAAAYEMPPTIESDLAHVRVSDAGNAIVVAFRGTESLRDWLTDLDALRVGWGKPGLGFEVHRGFLAAISSVFLEVREHILALDPARELFLAGHSLGGAEAMLCAAALKGANIVPHSIYTFGQPRVGNGKFARMYDEALGDRTFRFVNAEDLVPRVPGVLLGYRHAGQLAFLMEGAGIVLNPTFWLKVVSDVIGGYAAWRTKQDVLIKDHLVKNYMARLGVSGQVVAR